jgi:MFS family permease
LAGNIGALIAARAVQGAGAALVMPLAMALLSAAFRREERGKALGIFSAVTGLALIAGPICRRRHCRRPRLAVDLLD